MQLPEHEHEMYGEPDEEYFEDGAYITVDRCDYVVVTGSAYSEKHDEYFEETGPECEHTERTRYDLSEIQIWTGEDYVTLVECDDVFGLMERDGVDPRIIEDLESTIVTELTDRGRVVAHTGENSSIGIGPDGSRIITVECRGEEFRLVYSS